MFNSFQFGIFSFIATFILLIGVIVWFRIDVNEGIDRVRKDYWSIVLSVFCCIMLSIEGGSCLYLYGMESQRENAMGQPTNFVVGKVYISHFYSRGISSEGKTMLVVASTQGGPVKFYSLAVKDYIKIPSKFMVTSKGEIEAM